MNADHKEKPLQSRVALVAGASRGIGRAASLALAKAGAHVVLVARTTGALEEADDDIRALSGSATLAPLDVTDEAGVAKLADAVARRFGRLDILVGAAAVLGDLAPVAHTEGAAWDRIFATNVTANYRLIRYFDPLLALSDAGRAVFVTDRAVSSSSVPFWSCYAASKAALERLALSYAEEVRHKGIGVNLVSPRPTATRLRASAMPGEDASKLARPEEAAEKILFLSLPAMPHTGGIYDA
jgi:NAD(P)-dependent dehydrogenase (short-subunit alcohol dehydrogenase family)